MDVDENSDQNLDQALLGMSALVFNSFLASGDICYIALQITFANSLDQEMPQSQCAGWSVPLLFTCNSQVFLHQGL